MYIIIRVVLYKEDWMALSVFYRNVVGVQMVVLVLVSDVPGGL